MARLDPRILHQLRTTGSIFVNNVENRNEARLLVIRHVYENPEITVDDLYTALKRELHPLWVRSPKDLETHVLRRLSQHVIEIIDASGMRKERDPEIGEVLRIRGNDHLSIEPDFAATLRPEERPADPSRAATSLRALQATTLEAEGRLSFCDGLLTLLELDLYHYSKSFHIRYEDMRPLLDKLRSAGSLADPDLGLEGFSEIMRPESEARFLRACAEAIHYLNHTLKVERRLTVEERSHLEEEARAIAGMAGEAFTALNAHLEDHLQLRLRTFSRCECVLALSAYTATLAHMGEEKERIEMANQLLRRLADPLVLDVKGNTFHYIDTIERKETLMNARAPYLMALATIALSASVPAFHRDGDEGRVFECERTVTKALHELAAIGTDELEGMSDDEAAAERFGFGYGKVMVPHPGLALVLAAVSGAMTDPPPGADMESDPELIEALEELQLVGYPLLLDLRGEDGMWEDRNGAAVVPFTAMAMRALTLRSDLLDAREVATAIGSSVEDNEEK